MIKKRILVPCLIGAALFALALLSAQPKTRRRPPPPDSPAAERLAWWREARFGLFIHWGPVSLKGTEISWSRANTNPLAPTRAESRRGVRQSLQASSTRRSSTPPNGPALAKAAGTRYVVLTAKHCDGFCLWPTETIDYHIGNTPFKRDVCGELAAAVRGAGLQIGWYYSPMDWWDPDCRTAQERRLRQAHAGPDPRAGHPLRAGST